MTIYSWDPAGRPTMNGYYINVFKMLSKCPHMMRIGKSREYVWTLEDNFPPIFCELALGCSGRYPVYRSTTTGDFLYLYDWGKGLGMNWFISLEVSKPNSILLHLLTATTRWMTTTGALRVLILKRLTTAVQKRWLTLHIHILIPIHPSIHPITRTPSLDFIY